MIDRAPMAGIPVVADGEPVGLARPVPATAPASVAAPAGQEWAAALDGLRRLPVGASVLLACHVNPDGDALGSMLGFGLGLRQIAGRLGIVRLEASFPGPPVLPPPFDRLPGLDLLVAEGDADPAPDAVLAFDAASIERLGTLGDRLRAAPLSIVVDHHASNTRFGSVNLVDPAAAATSVLVEEFLRRLDVRLDAPMAEALYVALATDTGSFKFNTTTPAVHHLAARLIATGIDVGELSRRLFDSRSYGAVRLFGEALCRASLEPDAVRGRGLVWTYATLADLARYEQPPSVLESLIDSVRCVAEADVACVVKQVRDEEWAVSMRSKGAVDVSRVAVALGGGGHRLAAGFTGRGRLDEIVESIRTELAAEDQG